MKIKKIFKTMDWIAEFPRWMSVWSPAELMSPFEYGLKLLLGILEITALGLLVVLGTVVIPILGVGILVFYCPYVSLTISCTILLAFGIGWLRRKVMIGESREQDVQPSEKTESELNDQKDL